MKIISRIIVLALLCFVHGVNAQISDIMSSEFEIKRGGEDLYTGFPSLFAQTTDPKQFWVNVEGSMLDSVRVVTSMATTGSYRATITNQGLMSSGKYKVSVEVVYITDRKSYTYTDSLTPTIPFWVPRSTYGSGEFNVDSLFVFYVNGVDGEINDKFAAGWTNLISLTATRNGHLKTSPGYVVDLSTILDGPDTLTNVGDGVVTSAAPGTANRLTLFINATTPDASTGAKVRIAGQAKFKGLPWMGFSEAGRPNDSTFAVASDTLTLPRGSWSYLTDSYPVADSIRWILYNQSTGAVIIDSIAVDIGD